MFYENVKITKKKLCLGSKTIQKACAGDSGGPFIQTIVSCFQIYLGRKNKKI